MPFVASSTVKRLTPPAELGFGPDEWIEIRPFITVAQRRRILEEAGFGPDTSIEVINNNTRARLLEEIVVAWSDASPVTREAVAGLPIAVADWVVREFEALAVEAPDAGKNADWPSSPTTGQGAAISQPS